MTADEADYFLFIGSVDSEAATTRLRASGARYQKKMLSSRPENWTKIVDMVTSPHCRGALVVLTSSDYGAMCSPNYEDAARALLDALASRPHVVFVHEAVFYTEEQRAAAGIPLAEPERASVLSFTVDDEYFEIPREELFGTTSNEVRAQVSAMLRERQLNVYPYRKNAERSIIASQFLEDNERHLLFRLYVPVGRLYAEEADALLNLFREWLGQTGRGSFRQEGYRTDAGQVFEFFRAEGQPEGGLSRY